MTDEPLTEAELDELDRLISAASPAPWQPVVSSIVQPDYIKLDSNDNSLQDMYIQHGNTPAPTADIEFIAAARNYLPRLLAEVRHTRNLQRHGPLS